MSFQHALTTLDGSEPMPVSSNGHLADQVRLLVLTIAVLLWGTRLNAEERPTWHLELRNIGGGTDYKYPYSPVCFSPDSKHIAISVANQLSVFERLGKRNSLIAKDVPEGSGIGIWKVETLEFVKWIKTSARKFIRYSADGSSIGALDESSLTVWNVQTGEETVTKLIQNANFSDRLGHGFVFLPEGRVAAIRSKGIGVFEPDGTQTAFFKKDGVVDFVKIVASEDGKSIVADSYYWDLNTQSQIIEKQNMMMSSVFRPNTGEIWGRTRRGNGLITAWNASSGSRTLPIQEGQTRGYAENSSAQWRLESLAFTPNGKVLATVGADKNIHLWNVQTGSRFVTLQPATMQRKGKDDGGVGRPSLQLVEFSPDGQWLMACSVRSVSIFKTSTLKPHIKPGKVHQVVQYFAGDELFEEIVTNREGQKTLIGSMLHTEVQKPGKRVAALRHGNDELWYDAVILGRDPIKGVRPGTYYTVHYEGYSRDDDDRVPEWRLRPKLAQHLKLKDLAD